MSFKTNPLIISCLFFAISDLILDSKAVATDLYKLFDDDKNSLVTITELIEGFLDMFESFGVKIKMEFRESISSVAEIIRISHKGDLILPKRKLLPYLHYYEFN